MSTEQSRGWMAGIARNTKRYLSDLTDKEWDVIAPVIAQAWAAGPAARG